MQPNSAKGKTVRQRLDVTLALFLIFTIIAAYYLIASTLNYTEFYRAIREIHIANLRIDAFVEQENVNISLSFDIENPTRYIGLQLQSVTSQLYFLDNSEKVMLWWEMKAYGTTQPLDPYSKVPVEWSLTPIASTERFIAYFEAHNGAVNWTLECGVRLAAFLPHDISISFTEDYSTQ